MTQNDQKSCFSVIFFSIENYFEILNHVQASIERCFSPDTGVANTKKNKVFLALAKKVILIYLGRAWLIFTRLYIGLPSKKISYLIKRSYKPETIGS